MRNFFIWTGGIISVFLIIILVAGKTNEGNFTHETTVIFDVSKNLLWDIIDNVDAYNKNKYGIVGLKKKEFQGDNVISWREDYNFGISKDYEVIRKKDNEILVLKVRNNFTKMDTTLTLELSEDESKTYLKIKEESILNNIFYRGLKVLSGKDSYINSEIKWIRVGLYNYLINK